MAEDSIVQLFNDWEIQLLMLLSFALQLILFLFGGFRRRTSHILLRLPLWLAYLSADSIAVYALGYLSRHLPSTTTDTHKLSHAMSSQTHQLTLLWAPFLLIHLGGQDTVSAFSMEDNELWLRHLLNLLVQVCLVMYVLWKSVAHNLLVVPAIFAFVSGIAKYGERIWALKCASQKGLKSSSTSSQLVVKEPPDRQDGTELKYKEIVKYALYTERGVREAFAGRKLGTAWLSFLYGGDQKQIPDRPVGTMREYKAILENAIHTGRGVREAFAGRKLGQLLIGDLLLEGEQDVQLAYFYQQDEQEQLAFKLVDIELSIMYDTLYTKAKVIQTRLGTILRCVSLTSTMVAFVLFILMSGKQRYNYTGVDAAVTYILFIGASCLEACAIFIVMTSPQTWAFMEARGRVCQMLARVSWCIFERIHPKTKPLWSNSMGQYNLLESCMADKRRMIISKMMDVVGANEIWNNRHIRHAKVTTETKKLINQTIKRILEPLVIRAPMSELKRHFNSHFEQTLLFIHVFTDWFLCSHEADIAADPEMQRLKDACKGISEYMFYLLAVHPAMLPVGSNVQDLLANASESVRGRDARSKEGFLRENWRFFSEVKNMLEQGHDLHADLQMLWQVWVRLLIYAAGKSRPEEHARQLSMGGELLTFVWLLMAHRWIGDVHYEVDLVPKDPTEQSNRVFLFSP